MFCVYQFAEKKGFELIQDRLEGDDLDTAVSRQERGNVLYSFENLLLLTQNSSVFQEPTEHWKVFQGEFS